MIYKNLFSGVNLPEALSKEEFLNCYEKIILGDTMARKKVVEHNLRLVANQVSKKFCNVGVSLEDLASIGTIGLIKAVDTFDINKGFAFASYAIRCIDNEILMFLRKEKKHLNVDSFENSICCDKNGNELILEEMLADPNSDFMINFEKFEEQILIRRTIQKLPEKERKIMEMLYGFNGFECHTQAEIGALLNISQSYVSRLITKINKKVREQYLREKPLLYAFDVKEIHIQMTNDVFFSLLSMFPENDIKDYKKYRNIVDSSKFTSVMEENSSAEFIAHISLIEQDMRNMFEYYLQLKKKSINHDTAVLKVKKWASIHLLRFRYPGQSLQDLLQYVSLLPTRLKQAMVLRYGVSLLEFNEFSYDKSRQEQYLNLAHNKIDKFIKDDILNQPIQKTLLSKFPDKTFDELAEYLEKLPLKYKNVLYTRHGESLNQYHKFPNDKSYQAYYNLYSKAIHALEDLISGVEVAEKESKKKILLTAFSKEDLLYAVPKLIASDRSLVYLIHGDNLIENNPFPEAPKDKHPYYFRQKYYNLFKKIDKILQEREERKNNNAFIAKLGDYTYDEVIEEIELLKKEEREIIFLRHGENLDGLNPFPSKMPFFYYKDLYHNAVYNLSMALKKKKNPVEFEKRQRQLEEIRVRQQEEKKKNNKKRVDKKAIIYSEKREDLLWAMEYLSPTYKEILILRHGENLDSVLPWPEVPEGKYNNYYYANYYNMCKSIKNIIQNKEYFIKNGAKKKSHKSRETILDTIDHDKLLTAVMLLKDKQREIIYLRHGENLDKINPWPEVPEGKCSNYYYVIYSNTVKKINEIIQNGNKNQRKIHVSKNEIIYVTSREDLVYAINCLSEHEKNIFYLRHGENLDSVLPWPEVSDGKNKNYYYIAYKKIVNKIKEIIAKKEEENAIIKQKMEETKKVTKVIDKKKEIKEKRESFIETKSQLEQMKLRNFAATLYDKYIALYGSILTEKEIELIVYEAIDSYSYDEGLSLELSALFKIENKILLILSNKYRNNPDSEESLNILLLIEEIFGNRIKAHYTNTSYDTPYCYVSSELVSKAIEQALLDYTGRSPFYTEMALKLKKLY